ncbi:hypothetical protein DPX16_11039 [Anabarilius grahami]|uniref:Uncharacterized protein n=1 Tax=Anabarilius grahami TaxID=495550 RepID=A0A3N0Y3E1_ANAGA|nr:hypothetical protein DPX16_11039 [Anabarilius grahami]
MLWKKGRVPFSARTRLTGSFFLTTLNGGVSWTFLRWSELLQYTLKVCIKTSVDVALSPPHALLPWAHTPVIVLHNTSAILGPRTKISQAGDRLELKRHRGTHTRRGTRGDLGTRWRQVSILEGVLEVCVIRTRVMTCAVVG